MLKNDKENCQKGLTRKVVNNNLEKGGENHLALLNHVKEYRSELGINQTELGKLASVSRQTISLIERGDYSPSVTLALKLAKICGVKVEDLFEYEEDVE